MSDSVDIRVSPALDPETYMAVEGYSEETRGYVDDVVSLFNDIYLTLGKLADARKLADSNQAWPEEQKLLIVGAEANKQKDRLARRLDRTCSDLDSRIAHVEAELLKPVQQGAAAGPLAAEVRAHFKSLDTAERSALIREALDADDTSTIEAVLGAQPFLSGMTAVDRDHFIGLYHAKRQPHLVTRLDLMKRTRDTINSTGANGPTFHRAFDKVVGAKGSVVKAIEAANQRALDALKIEPS